MAPAPANIGVPPAVAPDGPRGGGPDRRAPRVAVIGAGVAGLCCATELSERGVPVSIHERGPGPGRDGASWLAGGMLAPWCECESAEEEVVRLGADAADWWAARVPGVERHGTLVLAPPRDRAELDRFGRRTERFERVDEARIGDLEPDLAGRFRAGLFFAEEAHIDPRAALESLAAQLEEHGVRIYFNNETDDPPDVDVVIDCRGFAARDVLPELRGVRGEMLCLHTTEVTLTRTVRMLHPRVPVYVVPRGGGLYMVGATMIESAAGGPITARSAMELLGAAYALHPAFAEAEIVETGAGIRPAFPDNLPRVVRQGAAPGWRIHVNGLYRHGFLLAPAMAKRAAEMVLGDTENAEKKPHAD